MAPAADGSTREGVARRATFVIARCVAVVAWALMAWASTRPFLRFSQPCDLRLPGCTTYWSPDAWAIVRDPRLADVASRAPTALPILWLGVGLAMVLLLWLWPRVAMTRRFAALAAVCLSVATAAVALVAAGWVTHVARYWTGLSLELGGYVAVVVQRATYLSAVCLFLLLACNVVVLARLAASPAEGSPGTAPDG